MRIFWAGCGKSIGSSYTGEVPRPFASHRPLSEFGRYVVHLCEKQKTTLAAFATLLGGKRRLSVIIRPRAPLSRIRGAMLTYEELSELARALHANRQETRNLILLGLMESAPKELQTCVAHLFNQNQEYAFRMGESPPPVTFQGIRPQLNIDPTDA